jgi:hypothetical protein
VGLLINPFKILQFHPLLKILQFRQCPPLALPLLRHRQCPPLTPPLLRHRHISRAVFKLVCHQLSHHCHINPKLSQTVVWFHQ